MAELIRICPCCELPFRKADAVIVVFHGELHDPKTRTLKEACSGHIYHRDCLVAELGVER